MSLVLHHLTADDIALMEALSTMFGEAFGDLETCTRNRPTGGYLQRLLDGESFTALAALNDTRH